MKQSIAIQVTLLCITQSLWFRELCAKVNLSIIWSTPREKTFSIELAYFLPFFLLQPATQPLLLLLFPRSYI